MYDYDYPTSGIKFTEPYIVHRGWRAAGTVDNIHVDVIDLHRHRGFIYEPCPDDLKKLMLYLGTDCPSDAINFWLELNCAGRWDRVGRYKIEFEFASDAMAYKLTWL